MEEGAFGVSGEGLGAQGALGLWGSAGEIGGDTQEGAHAEQKDPEEPPGDFAGDLLFAGGEALRVALCGVLSLVGLYARARSCVAGVYMYIYIICIYIL